MNIKSTQNQPYELTMTYLNEAPINMIKSQLLPIDITNPALIEAFTTIPRHLFIPEAQQSIAYCDGAIHLNNYYRPLLSAALYAKMLKAADIKPTDQVLDIGCLTGYSTAILSQLAQKVIAIEPEQTLASKAHTLLHKLRITNIIIVQNQLTDGHPDGAPYQVIIINHIIPRVEESILSQLDEGGTLIALIQKPNETIKLTRITKHQHHITYEVLDEIKKC